MRIMGGALGFVALHAAAGGMFLSAFVSGMFGVFDILAAEEVKQSLSEQFDAAASKPKGSILKNIFTGSNLYAALGLAGAAFMAAAGTPVVAAAMAVPIAIGAFFSMSNAARGKENINGHPMMWSALACVISGGTGLASGVVAEMLPGAALTVAAGFYAKIESQMTPGGFKKVVSDIISAPGRVLNKIMRRAPSLPAPQEPAFIAAPPVAESKIPDAGVLKKKFTAPAPRANASRRVAAPATPDSKPK